MRNNYGKREKGREVVEWRKTHFLEVQGMGQTLGGAKLIYCIWKGLILVFIFN